MFASYFQLGLEHILDPNGIDHVFIYFIVVYLFSI